MFVSLENVHKLMFFKNSNFYLIPLVYFIAGFSSFSIPVPEHLKGN